MSYNDATRAALGRNAIMDLFHFLTKWFWALGIVTTFINYGLIQARASQHIIAHSELRDGYRTLTKGFVIWGSLPWVVMGIGIVFGRVPSIFNFFRPRDGNPFVLAFFASVFLVWILGTYWLVFRGGAEVLVKYPGVLNINLKSSRSVMIYWFICLAAGVFAVILMFSRDIPLPPY